MVVLSIYSFYLFLALLMLLYNEYQIYLPLAYFVSRTNIPQADRDSMIKLVRGDHFFRGILVPRTIFFRTKSILLAVRIYI